MRILKDVKRIYYPKQNTCCFIGHQKLPSNKINYIVKNLDAEIDKLIHQGVTNFVSAATPGFAQIAASLIVAKKEMGANIRLVFALSNHYQIRNLAEPERQLYRSLLLEVDEIRFTSCIYTQSCIEERNCQMVDSSAYCICARLWHESEVEQTISYAIQQGLHIINVAK